MNSLANYIVSVIPDVRVTQRDREGNTYHPDLGYIANLPCRVVRSAGIGTWGADIVVVAGSGSRSRLGLDRRLGTGGWRLSRLVLIAGELSASAGDLRR